VKRVYHRYGRNRKDTEDTGADITDPELIRYQQAKAEGRKTVLFICTANAVRSQMAEALVNHFLKDKWEAFSAGFLPLAVHPMVKKVLSEIGIFVSSQKSKHLDAFKGIKFDKVITLCSDADAVCAYYPGLTEWEHIPFQDPALSHHSLFSGTSHFRKLRDEMKEVLIRLLEDR
jgi:arsenate reductase (thioredoxin)